MSRSAMPYQELEKSAGRGQTRPAYAMPHILQVISPALWKKDHCNLESCLALRRVVRLRLV